MGTPRNQTFVIISLFLRCTQARFVRVPPFEAASWKGGRGGRHQEGGVINAVCPLRPANRSGDCRPRV